MFVQLLVCFRNRLVWTTYEHLSNALHFHWMFLGILGTCSEHFQFPSDIYTSQPILVLKLHTLTNIYPEHKLRISTLQATKCMQPSLEPLPCCLCAMTGTQE